jgi:predicted HicB family RNase H-like nuclease
MRKGEVQTMAKEQAEADFYALEEGGRLGEHVTPSGRRPMTGHAAVRFPQTTIDQIKTLAAEDGVTVSTWIRRVVDEAVRSRSASKTEPGVKVYFTLLSMP